MTDTTPETTDGDLTVTAVLAYGLSETIEQLLAARQQIKELTAENQEFGIQALEDLVSRQEYEQALGMLQSTLAAVSLELSAAASYGDVGNAVRVHLASAQSLIVSARLNFEFKSQERGQ